MLETPKNESPAAEARQKMRALLASRKFWAALIGLILLVIKAFVPDFPLDEEQLTHVVYLLAAYILGTAIEDGRARS